MLIVVHDVLVISHQSSTELNLKNYRHFIFQQFYSTLIVILMYRFQFILIVLHVWHLKNIAWIINELNLKNYYHFIFQPILSYVNSYIDVQVFIHMNHHTYITSKIPHESFDKLKDYLNFIPRRFWLTLIVVYGILIILYEPTINLTYKISDCSIYSICSCNYAWQFSRR